MTTTQQCDYREVCSACYPRSEQCIIYYHQCSIYKLRQGFKERGLDDMFGGFDKKINLDKIRRAGL